MIPHIECKASKKGMEQAVVPGLDDHVLAGGGAAECGGRGAVRGRHELGLLALGAPIGARVPRLVEGSGLHTYTQPGI